MTPESDCVIRIPATSDVGKTERARLQGRARRDRAAVRHRASPSRSSWTSRARCGFLPGQYVNIQVPGTDQTRSFSFSSAPGADEAGFLIRNTPHGVLTTYLRDRAKPGDAIEFNGPLGSFYLREIKRPVLFLAGGTGLAPFLSMLARWRETRLRAPDPPDLRRHQRRATWSRWTSWRGTPQRHPELHLRHLRRRRGQRAIRTRATSPAYIEPEHLNDGDVDIYLCGPPPMVDAVRACFPTRASTPANFYYEKFAHERRGRRRCGAARS